jgi:predicted aspartyl protease
LVRQRWWSHLCVLRQGSGVSDAISEGDTSAEVIDTGSDGRFVVTTEGSERLRITSAGLVGIGTNSPTDGDSSQWVDISPQGSGVSDAISEGDTSAEVIDTGSDGRFVVTTEGSERLRITSAGLVGIGTNSPNNKLDVVGVTQVYDSRGTSVYDSLKLIGGSAVDFPTIEAVSTTSPLHFKTNSNVRMAITSTGLVGIGTNSPSVSLHVVGGGMFASSTTGGSIVQARNSDFSSLGYFGVEGSTGGVTLTGTLANSTFISSGASGTPLQFGTGGVIRSTLTSTGLGIGTSSPDGKLHVEDTANDLQVRVGGATAGRDPLIRLQGRNTADNTNVYADIKLDSDNRLLLLNDPGTTGGSIGQNPVAITETGAVGIGTTSPGYPLHVFSSTSTVGIRVDGGGDSIVSFANAGSAVGAVGIAAGNIAGGGSGNIGIQSGSSLLFATGGVNEKARLDSSGRLLVGTSTEASNNLLVVEGSTTSDTGAAIAALKRGTDVSGMSTNDYLGILRFTSRDSHVFADIAGVCDATPGTNDYPGRLVFSTTADGASGPTERMRITRGGDLFSLNADNGIVSRSTLPAGTANTIFAGQHSATSIISGTNCFRVYTNGNVQNTNNSYGALSDIKLKENIVDANSQWDDLKALQVRNYNFKEGQTHTQIGLVAQEVELVSPGLVTESPDRDEDGNDLGTVTKSVNYSVLYMKAVKALQEAMTRIETLEAANTDLAARLTALEGGTN